MAGIGDLEQCINEPLCRGESQSIERHRYLGSAFGSPCRTIWEIALAVC